MLDYLICLKTISYYTKKAFERYWWPVEAFRLHECFDVTGALREDGN